MAALLAASAGDGSVGGRAVAGGDSGGGRLDVEMGGMEGGVGGGLDTHTNNTHIVVFPGDAAKLACPLYPDVFGSVSLVLQCL